MTQTFLALTQVLHLLCILLFKYIPGNVPLLVPTLTWHLVLLPPLPSLSNVCVIHLK